MVARLSVIFSDDTEDSIVATCLLPPSDLFGRWALRLWRRRPLDHFMQKPDDFGRVQTLRVQTPQAGDGLRLLEGHICSYVRPKIHLQDVDVIREVYSFSIIFSLFYVAHKSTIVYDFLLTNLFSMYAYSS
jgi:hypothetical protein